MAFGTFYQCWKQPGRWTMLSALLGVYSSLDMLLSRVECEPSNKSSVLSSNVTEIHNVKLRAFRRSRFWSSPGRMQQKRVSGLLLRDLDMFRYSREHHSLHLNILLLISNLMFQPVMSSRYIPTKIPYVIGFQKQFYTSSIKLRHWNYRKEFQSINSQLVSQNIIAFFLLIS